MSESLIYTSQIRDASNNTLDHILANVAFSNTVAAAYAEANAAYSAATAAYAEANVAYSSATSALSGVGAAYAEANAAYSSASFALTVAEAAYAKANAGTGGFSQSASANGYVTLPGGIKFVWGVYNVYNGGEVGPFTESFPYGFTSAVFTVLLIADGGTPMWTENYTTTTFEWGTGYTGGKTATKFTMLAVGI